MTVPFHCSAFIVLLYTVIPLEPPSLGFNTMWKSKAYSWKIKTRTTHRPGGYSVVSLFRNDMSADF